MTEEIREIKKGMSFKAMPIGLWTWFAGISFEVLKILGILFVFSFLATAIWMSLPGETQTSLGAVAVSVDAWFRDQHVIEQMRSFTTHVMRFTFMSILSLICFQLTFFAGIVIIGTYFENMSPKRSGRILVVILPILVLFLSIWLTCFVVMSDFSSAMIDASVRFLVH